MSNNYTLQRVIYWHECNTYKKTNNMKKLSKDIKLTETQDTINFLKIKIEALEKECIMLRSELADVVCD